jgi:hypothetical protein
MEAEHRLHESNESDIQSSPTSWQTRYGSEMSGQSSSKYALYLKLERNSFAISFTTLDHRLELFIQVSTDDCQYRNVERWEHLLLPNLPKLPQEIAEDRPCLPRCFLPKP